mgnify:CR=1 FL=1
MPVAGEEKSLFDFGVRERWTNDSPLSEIPALAPERMANPVAGQENARIRCAALHLWNGPGPVISQRLDVEQNKFWLIALNEVAGLLQGGGGQDHVTPVLKHPRQSQQVLAFELDDKDSFCHGLFS